MKDYQRMTRTTIPKGIFQDIMRELVMELNKKRGEKYRYNSLALLATQEAAEQFMTVLFHEAAELAKMDGRAVVDRKDILLARRMVVGEI